MRSTLTQSLHGTGRLRLLYVAAGLTLMTAAAGAGEPPAAGDNGPMRVDFRYAPPEWQTAICLPDDPQKTLVDHRGRLRYHWRGGAAQFGLSLAVEISPDATQTGQALVSPRIPIVRTLRRAPGLAIVEEAFAVTEPLGAGPPPKRLQVRRTDGQQVLDRWAHPPKGVNPWLGTIAVHMGGSIRYAVHVEPKARATVALALCEGYHDGAGRRVQVLRVEGAEPRTVDTIGDLGKNVAGAFWFDARDADGDGRIAVEVAAHESASDKNTILNALWVFEPAVEADDAALLAGRLDGKALADVYPSNRDAVDATRNDVLLVQVTNTGKEPRQVSPCLMAEAYVPLRADLEGQRLAVSDREAVFASRRIVAAKRDGKVTWRADLEPMTIPAGETARLCITHAAGRPPVVRPKTVDEAVALREKAEAYWQAAALPYGRVQVPDAGVQALIDASIRNIWQAREIKGGLPAFQVGPTCYRGLWIVDGAFLLETAAILGAADQARAGITYMLSHQQDDGRFELINTYHKENGIVLWACVRHARLARDKAWLESVWPKLEKTVAYIRRLRRETYTNETPLDDGLVPPGFPDGGLGARDKAEFTNVYWNLAGLKAAIDGARWLGKSGRVLTWQAEYHDFLDAFRRAAGRNMRTDEHGHPYLPIFIGKAGAETLPQKAQWAFCHAVYPGQVFRKDDPLVATNLEMLRATEREGMVMSTGWMTGGIWNYFASFYGHVWLWQGDGAKAARCLYAMANHASPLLAWREEQPPRGEPYRAVGDMPHNWASAEFIRLAVHLLAIDRGRELHLLEGLPPAWTGPGMVTRLDGIATPFGPLRMTLAVDDDGRAARLTVDPLPAADLQRIVVHREEWAAAKAARPLPLDPKEKHEVRIPLRAD
jgi:hypothetical protein